MERGQTKSIWAPEEDGSMLIADWPYQMLSVIDRENSGIDVVFRLYLPSGFKDVPIPISLLVTEGRKILLDAGLEIHPRGWGMFLSGTKAMLERHSHKVWSASVNVPSWGWEDLNRDRGRSLTAPLPHHPACGSAPGGSRD